MKSRLGYGRILRLAVLALAGKLVLCGCGMLPNAEVDVKAKKTAPPEQENDQEADLTVGEDGRLQLSFTADYRFPPVDVLIIEESNGVLAGAPFADRLANAGATLATKLLFTDLDIRLGFLTAAIPPKAPDGTPQTEFGGELVDDGGPAILTKDMIDFKALVVQRMVPVNSTYSQRPLTALKTMFDRSLLPASKSAGFFRDGALLAVVFIQHGDETAEQLLPEDIEALLNEKKGVGQWSVSSMVPDAEGCEISEGRLTNAEDYVRRNLLRRMALRGDGLLESLCMTNYSYFFNDFVGDGTKSRYWKADLPAPAMWESIRLTADGTDFVTWRYAPGENSLYLPVTIPRGATVSISYELDDGTKENVAVEKEIPFLKERKLSPEEAEFNVQINPVLRGNCAGGACHSAGSGQNTYIDSYKVVVNNRAAILDRIQRPDGDPQKMPQGRTMAPAELQRLIDFLLKIQ